MAPHLRNILFLKSYIFGEKMKPYTCKQLRRWLLLQIYKVTFHIVWCYGYYTCTRISDFFCFCLIKEAGSDMKIISVYTPIYVLPVCFSELDKLGYFNSFNYQKADDKIFVCKFSKMSSPSFIILRIQRLEGKQCRSS